MAIHLHKGDLPEGLDFGASVAVDTETQGLSLMRDKLCLVQLSAGDGNAHIVQLDRDKYDCPNLKALLADVKIEKIFHFARFDVAMLKQNLDIDVAPIYCTKIASALIRTYTDAHGLKNLCKELLNIDLSKQQQSSDWATESLTKAQQEYAASDVLYLHQLQRILTARLMRENRFDMAKSCFDFMPTRAALDLAGWNEIDIFSHNFR
ncbi:MAG: ribonuclease D [Robiginitomaculum sp.]|nr:ribonuclease D [Robiginitomaculum sp.]